MQRSAMVVACSAALLLATAHASAGTVPVLTAEVKTSSVDGDAAYTHAGFGAAGLTVHRIFVEGLEVGDEVNVVFGDGTSPLTIQTSAASFFNAPEVGQVHSQPTAGNFESTPSTQWDTWLALGNIVYFVSPGFPNVALEGGGANVIDNTDMAWFAITGFVNGDGRMLLGQFAFAEDSEFEITVSINVERGEDTLVFRDLTYTFGEPSDPIGACCVGTTCSEVTESECASLKGVFSGADTLCSEVQCNEPPPLVGACCIEDKCEVVTEEVCDLIGTVVEAVFHGVGSTCEEVDCTAVADPVGACCVGEVCAVMAESLCRVASGTFQGEDSICESNTCEPVVLTGACCIFGECADLLPEFCALSGGEFLGVGTICDQSSCIVVTTGACCIAGQCEVLTEQECEDSFGEFQGLGSECKDVTCPAAGACCVDGVCVQLSETICAARDGFFTEEGVDCDGVECELPAIEGTGGHGGFWHSPGLPHWPYPFKRSTYISEVFDMPSCVTDWEMHLRQLGHGPTFHGGGSPINRSARHLMKEAIPALLNAQQTKSGVCTSDYPIGDPDLLVQLVNQTLATCDPEQFDALTMMLDAYNHLPRVVTPAGRCLD